MDSILSNYNTVKNENVQNWVKVAKTVDFPDDGGLCIKYKDKQIAVFNFSRRNEWYACQNLCPHKLEMVLSRGLLGDAEGVAKVACPLHKRNFSLETGENLNGDLPSIAVYPIKIEHDFVYVGFMD